MTNEGPLKWAVARTGGHPNCFPLEPEKKKKKKKNSGNSAESTKKAFPRAAQFVEEQATALDE